MSTQPMPLVQVFAPDGTLGDIPYDRLHDAISAGAKLATKIKAPDGTMGYVPADQRAAALKAGGTAIPFDLSDHDGQKPGFWSHVGESLKAMTAGPQDIGEAAKEGLVRSLGAAPAIYGAGKEMLAANQRGHDLPYSAAAGLSTLAGVSPERMEQAAEQGDTAGVLGETAVPLALTATGEVVKKVGPAARAGAREALFTPEGKPTPLGKALSHPTEAAIDYTLRKVVGAPDFPVKLEAVNIRQSPNFDPVAYNAGRKGVSLQELAAAQAAKEGTGITVVPEPRGQFSGEVPNYMASVPRGTLEDLAVAAKPGAGAQLQQLGRPIIYEPRGAGISNVKSSVSLSEMAPGKPDYAYRVRSVGEEGVPADQRSPAHATTTRADAESLLPGRESVVGQPQEMVRYDLSKLKEGVDYIRVPRPGQPDWIRQLRPLPESAVRKVTTQ